MAALARIIRLVLYNPGDRTYEVMAQGVGTEALATLRQVTSEPTTQKKGIIISTGTSLAGVDWYLLSFMPAFCADLQSHFGYLAVDETISSI